MAARKKSATVVRAASPDARPRTRGRVRQEGAAFPVPPTLSRMPDDYRRVLTSLKARIASAQTRASLAVSRELISLYWHVGATIAERQATAGWGDAVVERLAHDLRKAFPELQGFSPRNVWRMRAFFVAWSGGRKKLTQPVSETGVVPADPGLPRIVSQLPWGHNILLVQKLKRADERLWYAEQAQASGWSRAVLQRQIANGAFKRKGRATTNFAMTLPPPQSDLVQQALKDPYAFDFLTVGREAHERVTERALVARVRDFLLELGAGFAFLGNQVKLTIGETDYFIDLLFYHAKLHCYVVVELKAGKFKPDHVGQLNFYLSAVDDLLKQPVDQPTVGLLLCRSRDRVHVEYALRGLAKPIGVAEWETKLTDRLPEGLEGSLPTVEEIEAELSREGGEP